MHIGRLWGGVRISGRRREQGLCNVWRNVWRKLLLLVLLRVVRLLLLLVVRLVVAVAVAVALSTRAHTALSLAGSTCRRASVPRLCCRRRLYYVQS